MMKDNHVAGEGNAYYTLFREYDPDLGRWWRPDPIFQPWQSPYSAFDGNPIMLTDVWGLKVVTDPDGTQHYSTEDVVVTANRYSPPSFAFNDIKTPAVLKQHITDAMKNNTNGSDGKTQATLEREERDNFQVQRNSGQVVTTTAKSWYEQAMLLHDAKFHYNYANGDPWFIDASRFDFTFISQKDLVQDEDYANIFHADLVKKDKNATSIVFGKIRLQKISGDVFCILPDEYDFDMEWSKVKPSSTGIQRNIDEWWNMLSSERNLYTILAGAVNEYGIPYPTIPFVTSHRFFIYVNSYITVKP